MLQLNINVIQSSTNLALDKYNGGLCWFIHVYWNVWVPYFNFRRISLWSGRHFLFQILV